jgi:cell division protein FtsA
LQYVASVPQGSDHLTDELASRLGVSQATAERLKNLDGAVVWRACDAFEMVEIAPVGAVSPADTFEVSRRRLTEILRPLSEAILAAAVEELRRAPESAQIAARRGVVLTGGGAQQDGMVELAAEMLGGWARLGRPQVLPGWEEPQVAAASGALALAAGDDRGIGFAPGRRMGGPLGRPLESFGQWLRESLGVA